MQRDDVGVVQKTDRCFSDVSSGLLAEYGGQEDIFAPCVPYKNA